MGAQKSWAMGVCLVLDLPSHYEEEWKFGGWEHTDPAHGKHGLHKESQVKAEITNPAQHSITYKHMGTAGYKHVWTTCYFTVTLIQVKGPLTLGQVKASVLRIPAPHKLCAACNVMYCDDQFCTCLFTIYVVLYCSIQNQGSLTLQASTQLITCKLTQAETLMVHRGEAGNYIVYLVTFRYKGEKMAPCRLRGSNTPSSQ